MVTFASANTLAKILVGFAAVSGDHTPQFVMEPRNSPTDPRTSSRSSQLATRYGFGFALMMTWLSLTTTEKSTPFALYCSMIFGACALSVLSSFP